MKKRYLDFNTYLRGIYGDRVQKITVDAGLNCPNRDGTLSTGGCIYCNPKGSGTGAHAKGLSITEQILQGKAAIYRRYKAKKYLVYFQAFTNTYAPLDTLKKIYAEALEIPDVVGIAIGTRPDCISEDVLDLLTEYARHHVIWLEYGLQSAHDRTLVEINRGHDFQCFKDAVEATQNRGIKICAHIILGLPNETREQMLETARTVARMNIQGIKIHLLYLIKGTRLDALYQAGGYKCLTQREYAELVCDVLEVLPPDMVIQRLSSDPHPHELRAPLWALQKSDNLELVDEILEGRDSFQGRLFDPGPGK
jgi:uncharacterized protein